MTIGFEAKRLFTNFTGLGNYGRFVVDALSKHESQNRYVLFTPKQRHNRELDAIVSRKNVEVVGPTGLSKTVSSAWRTFGMSFSSAIRDVDVFHGLSQELPFGLPARIKKIVTVHDLIFLRFPEYYNPVDVAIYKAKVKSACKRADVIIAISQQTKEDLINFLKIDDQKIKVVYQGCHPNFKRLSSADEKTAARSKYQLPDRYILNVGTIEPRKNVGLLVEALSKLPADLQLPVVVVGRQTPYLEKVMATAAANHVAEKIHFIHGASFEDLPAIYQMASVFVYPSRFEGFGIPLVEAIESKVPVITSTGSCFTEAAGPGAMYVDPDDSSALASDLTKVLSDRKLEDEMRIKSADFVRRFEPGVIAKHLMEVYQS